MVSKVKRFSLAWKGTIAVPKNSFAKRSRSRAGQNEPGELANAWYGFACGAALTGHRGEALGYLSNAVDHGFAASGWMETDPDLQSLHSDPRFGALVAKARQSAATQPR